jgi:hypothetical protein
MLCVPFTGAGASPSGFALTSAEKRKSPLGSTVHRKKINCSLFKQLRKASVCCLVGCNESVFRFKTVKKCSIFRSGDQTYWPVFLFIMYVLQHYFMYRPSIRFHVGIEPRTAATLALKARRSKHSARSKAVNRGDKRSRLYRDRHFAKFERSRRYRDRYRC